MQQGTFADVGTPFTLFEGPVAHALDTLGAGRCALCGRDGFCLELSIGYDLVGPCGTCGATTDVPVDGPFARCVSCDAVCRLPKRADGRPACLTCLKDGRFAITKGTDFGMVRWRDARTGLTHGLPLPHAADGSPPTTYGGFPAEAPNESGWQSIRVGSDALLRLVLTPDFDSVQGAVWKFHCGQPMTLVGRWGKRDFEQHAPDGDGASFAHRIADVPGEAYAELGDTASQDSWAWAYVFRCTTCDTRSGNWDG